MSEGLQNKLFCIRQLSTESSPPGSQAFAHEDFKHIICSAQKLKTLGIAMTGSENAVFPDGQRERDHNTQRYWKHVTGSKLTNR